MFNEDLSILNINVAKLVLNCGVDGKSLIAHLLEVLVCVQDSVSRLFEAARGLMSRSSVGGARNMVNKYRARHLI